MEGRAIFLLESVYTDAGFTLEDVSSKSHHTDYIPVSWSSNPRFMSYRSPTCLPEQFLLSPRLAAYRLERCNAGGNNYSLIRLGGQANDTAAVHDCLPMKKKLISPRLCLDS
jgi:hypothetical protein